jgi:hypothetical protein
MTPTHKARILADNSRAAAEVGARRSRDCPTAGPDNLANPKAPRDRACVNMANSDPRHFFRFSLREIFQ